MDDFDNFRKLLEAEQKLPGPFTFKFIVPEMREKEADILFFDQTITKRPSRTGKYISFTFTADMPSPDAVIEIYKKAHTIPGVIAL